MEPQSTEHSGVILTKKPRQPRGANATILSTSYSVPAPVDADADADAAGSAALIHKYEVGVDEAGRGPLFGRVYTGAVILPHPCVSDVSDAPAFDFSLLKDSKKFHSEKKIREVSDYIKQHAVAWAISYEEADVIDSLNIRRATLQCMRKSINTLIDAHIEDMEQLDKPRPTTEDYLLLIDGNDFIPLGKYNEEMDQIDTYTHVCVEGGDNTYACIAAASILAKVARDDYIEKLCDQHPVLDEMYSLRGNKGYGAKKHIDGIREHGITQWHRRSYGICKQFV
jgi:ribonuclease HII